MHTHKDTCLWAVLSILLLLGYFICLSTEHPQTWLKQRGVWEHLGSIYCLGSSPKKWVINALDLLVVKVIRSLLFWRFQNPTRCIPVQPALNEPALAGGLDWMISRGLFQLAPFCDCEQSGCFLWGERHLGLLGRCWIFFVTFFLHSAGLFGLCNTRWILSHAKVTLVWWIVLLVMAECDGTACRLLWPSCDRLLCEIAKHSCLDFTVYRRRRLYSCFFLSLRSLSLHRALYLCKC